MPKRQPSLRIDKTPPIRYGSSTTDDGDGDVSPPPPSGGGRAPEPPTLTGGILQSAVTPSAYIDAAWEQPALQQPGGYYVQYSTSSTFPTGSTTTLYTAWRTIRLAPLVPNTTYYVRYGPSVNGVLLVWSESASTTTPSDTAAPTPPSGLSATFINAGDLSIAWTESTSANYRDTEITIWNSSAKTTLYGTFYSAVSPFVWTAAQNLAATSGAGDPSVYVELRSRSWANVFSAAVSATATKSPPSAPTVTADFTGKDCVFTITPPADAQTLRFVADTGVTARDIGRVGRYTYTFDTNRLDHGGTADPVLSYSITAVDALNQTSAATTGTATNAAPSAPTSVSVNGFFSTFSVSVTATEPADFDTYRYRIIQTSPSAADVVIDSPSNFMTRAVNTAATYQVGVRVGDVFGQTSAETLSSTLILDALTLADLRNRIVYSDDLGTAAATLKTAMSDDVRASGGVSYPLTSGWTHFIRADWLLQERIEVITLSMTPASGTTSWYMRTSADGSTWNYFAGPVVATGSSGSTTTLTSVASATAAQSAAVSTATLGGSSSTRVDLPTMQQCRYIEVWFRNTAASTRVDEFFPRRLIQADDVEAESIRAINIAVASITADRLSVAKLSAITANIGGLVIDSTGYLWQGTGTPASPTTGLKIYNVGGIGKLSTYNGGVEQVTLDTDGKLKAGAGNVILDADGLQLSALTSTMTANSIRWMSGGIERVSITGMYSSGTSSLNLRTSGGGQGTIGLLAPRGPLGYADAQLSLAGGTSVTALSTARIDAESIKLIGVSDATILAADILLSGSTRVNNGLSVGTATGAATGNVCYSANLVPLRGGTYYTGYIYAPIAGVIASSYNNVSLAVGTYTISYSDFSGVPGAAKALALRMSGRWPSAGVGVATLRYPGGQDAVIIRSQAANTSIDSSGVVGLDGSGNFQLTILAATVSSLYIICVGYYI